MCLICKIEENNNNDISKKFEVNKGVCYNIQGLIYSLQQREYDKGVLEKS